MALIFMSSQKFKVDRERQPCVWEVISMHLVGDSDVVNDISCQGAPNQIQKTSCSNGFD